MNTPSKSFKNLTDSDSKKKSLVQNLNSSVDKLKEEELKENNDFNINALSQTNVNKILNQIVQDEESKTQENFIKQKTNDLNQIKNEQEMNINDEEGSSLADNYMDKQEKSSIKTNQNDKQIFNKEGFQRDRDMFNVVDEQDKQNKNKISQESEIGSQTQVENVNVNSSERLQENNNITNPQNPLAQLINSEDLSESHQTEFNAKMRAERSHSSQFLNSNNNNILNIQRNDEVSFSQDQLNHSIRLNFQNVDEVLNVNQAQNNRLLNLNFNHFNNLNFNVIDNVRNHLNEAQDVANSENPLPPSNPWYYSSWFWLITFIGVIGIGSYFLFSRYYNWYGRMGNLLADLRLNSHNTVNARNFLLINFPNFIKLNNQNNNNHVPWWNRIRDWLMGAGILTVFQKFFWWWRR